MCTAACLAALPACDKTPQVSEEKLLTASAMYFKGFSFITDANPVALLGGNVKCAVDTAERVIAGATMLPSDLRQLVPTFLVSDPAIEVRVGGQVQVSGQNPQDFTQPVVYTLRSGEVEVEYTVRLRNFTGLPVVLIDTEGDRPIVNKEDWVPATFRLQGNGRFPDQELTMGIRGRGNSTWGYPKKPYALKLDSKESVMGMPKHKRWVLLANWMDRTLLRNRAAFYLARQTSLDWTPRNEFVEVFLNGKHLGNYLLTEQIRVDANRVNVHEETGYLFELDTYFDEPNKFKTRLLQLPVMLKNPDEEIITKEQITYAETVFNQLEELLWQNDYPKYWDRMDMNSFVDWWLVHEVTGNAEPNHPKSSYMHMDVGGKLIAGPVWDFDWGTFRDKGGPVLRNAIWYGYFFKNHAFCALVKSRWAELKPKFETLPDFLRAEAAYLEASDVHNARMWPITSDVNQDTKLSFPEAVDRMISRFTDKMAAMDKAIGAL